MKKAFKLLLPSIISSFLLPVICVTAMAQLPEVYIMDAASLASVKKSVQAKDKAVLQNLQPLLQEANRLLEMKPVSVMEKAFTPVSGNKHDYMSQAPYFWYDSSKPNGLPYLRRDYLNWLLTSKNGKEEYAAKNNHGTWYYVQVVDFALFTGNTARARELAEESKRRMDSQLTAEGQMPLEVARTNGLGYSTYNLRAWFSLAKLAAKVNTDLWHYTTSKGVGLRKALDWLTPYALGEKSWTWQQINSYNKSDIYPLYRQAAAVWQAPAYTAHAQQLAKAIKDPIEILIYSR